jgi:hypothetical protein
MDGISEEDDMMENTDLTEILKPYSNKWVALSSDSNKVVGVADKIADAIEEAKLHNEKEPILTKVPEHYGTFIL